MEICMQTPLLSLLLNLVLSVENVMLPIDDLMVDGGCIATTGGRRLFCIETYREGKTPGSVLCVMVYAYECALLVIIRVYDAKKILVDALGTLRTTGTRSL
jgi:hypothetical protein